jgi:hypothetical protein
MGQSRHRTMTYRAVNARSRPLEELLSAFSIDSDVSVSDEELAADMQLLTSGQMSPEEHRAYLKGKYSPNAA